VSHNPSPSNNTAPVKNFTVIGAPDGDRNPSSVPAITSSGTVPATSRIASTAARASESLRV
jgi:hypothetical protein